MDNINAPQWADFTAPSPQVCLDDFFLSRSKTPAKSIKKLDLNALECKNTPKNKITPTKLRKGTCEQENISGLPSSNVEKVEKVTTTEQQNTTEKTKQTKDSCYRDNSSDYDSSSLSPIMNPSCKVTKLNLDKSKSSPAANTKSAQSHNFVPVENVLIEAMNNLQVSCSSMNKTIGSCKNKSCILESPLLKKSPTKRITRSVCSQYQNALLKGEEINLEDSIPEENKEEFKFKETERNVCEQIESNVKEANIQSDEAERAIQTMDTVKMSDEIAKLVDDEAQKATVNEALNFEIKKTQKNKKELPKSKIVTSFKADKTSSEPVSKAKKPQVTGNAWHRQEMRRRSIKLLNKRVQEYKAKTKGTEKFISLAEAVKNYEEVTPPRFKIKLTRAEQLRRVSLKLTRATSPALLSKKRIRPGKTLSSEEREILEIEKLKQTQLKPNPICKKKLKNPAPLKPVFKKTVTIPQPFNLTEVKKHCPNDSKTQEIKKNQPHMQKKTVVPAIVVSNDKGVLVKEEEILYFGIPIAPGNSKKRNTKVEPFSFAQRDKELLEKKEEKIKKLQESEKKKNQAEFHARPVPLKLRTTPISNISMQRPHSAPQNRNKVIRNLSFEKQKKTDTSKTVEEDKPPVFKAQPVPAFKPVLVRGRSKDSLLKKVQANEKSKLNSKIDPIQMPLKKTMDNENQENREPSTAPKILDPKQKLSSKSQAILSELNTDKRAKERRVFDDKLKHREMEFEINRKKEQKYKVDKEKADLIAIRQQAVIKARPMPIYKPIQILKSNKPLTEAASPMWARKQKPTTH